MEFIKRNLGIHLIVILALAALALASGCEQKIFGEPPEPKIIEERPDFLTMGDIDIYEAAIIKLVTEDSSFEKGFKPPVIFLRKTTDDKPLKGINPDLSILHSEPLPEELFDRIKHLSKKIVLVETREAAMDPSKTLMVKDEGIYVSVGNVQEDKNGNRVLAAHLYRANAGAVWYTYKITIKNDKVILKPVGPVAIS